MARSLAIFGFMVAAHLASTYAGQVMSCCQQNSDDPDPCPPAVPIPVPQDCIWKTCAAKPASGKWACEADGVTFPTVECIVADMKTCGNVGENSVFYSFGANTPPTRGFRDTLNPSGTMFNDALDQSWWNAIVAKFPFTSQGPLQQLFTIRYSQAMAKAASGTAYVAVPVYNGKAGGFGAYQNPDKPNPPNVWLTYEFPTLQQNPNVVSVVSVDLSNNNQQSEDWRNGEGNYKQLPYVDADSLPVPAHTRRRRNEGGVIDESA